jgi:hypothetical protein
MEYDENDDSYEYQTVEIGDDPEEAALNILAPNLPKTRLDEIDISSEAGQAAAIARIMAVNYGKAAVEKDEIIGFVQKNKKHLVFFINNVLQPLIEIMPMVYGDALSKYTVRILEGLKYADEGKYEKINVQSDKLIWLIYVLAMKLEDGKMNYDEALSYLQKPQNKERISLQTLLFMLNDYLALWDKPNRPALEYLMLMSEAARMINEPPMASASFSVVVKVGEVNTPANLLRFIENLQPFLSHLNKITEEDLASIKRIRNRYVREIDPTDF